jgi:hypothetical protein
MPVVEGRRVEQKGDITISMTGVKITTHRCRVRIMSWNDFRPRPAKEIEIIQFPLLLLARGYHPVVPELA